jgi:hypothetical protein
MLIRDARGHRKPTPFTPLAVRSATPAGFVGITGWLPSEQVAGMDRNRRLFSSEPAPETENLP